MIDVVVVGGGASGLIAAILSKNKNNRVTILERNNICGKKILMTGNGRCNYWNSNQDISHYHSSNKELLLEFFSDNISDKVLPFFERLGIVSKIKNGYYYPYSNQAISIRDALVSEAQKKNIEIRNNFLVEDIEKVNNKFIVSSNSQKIECDIVILATGSKASPKTGSDGIGYKLAKSFNHTIIDILPSLVQLKGKDPFFKEWEGIRSEVEVSLYENETFIKKEIGEIQLTNYGISGICIFNVSGLVAKGLKQGKKEVIKINFLPFLNEKNPKLWFSEQEQLTNNLTIEELVNGFLNNKLTKVILNEAKIDGSKFWRNLSDIDKEILIKSLISFEVKITDTNSFDQAQVCSGGISLSEINLQTMESKLVDNLYIIGELLDVDGDCGGYNLGFAWMSAIKAGNKIGEAK